ncbi:hypothetical protein BJV82DRAFT_668011 [Fennellomyces sp. T-0311]|nr:hypothetical protein BJV82DRAFT_668011 [Fennellomyces sp. T-0311]
MARAMELSHLWKDQTPQDKQWRRLTSTNPFHQQYKKLPTGLTPPKNPVAEAIDKKRDEEFTSRCNEYKSIRCLRPYRLIDPILYLAASSKGRHRLVKWRMHWRPSYPLKDCECGAVAANREHYTNCLLLRPLYQELLGILGSIPDQLDETHSPDHILNSLPRSDTGLTPGKWKKAWPALLHVLRKIDKLSHLDEEYDEEEPAPEEALQGSAPTTTRNHP